MIPVTINMNLNLAFRDFRFLEIELHQLAVLPNLISNMYYIALSIKGISIQINLAIRPTSFGLGLMAL